jgi:hypothetical protein
MVDELEYLALTSEARLVLLTILICKHNNIAAIFDLSRDHLQRQTGYSARIVDRCIKELCHTPPDSPWIAYGDGIVWIINGVKHNVNISLENEKHSKAIKKVLSDLPKNRLVKKFCEYYELQDMWGAIAYPVDSLPYSLYDTSNLISVSSKQKSTKRGLAIFQYIPLYPNLAFDAFKKNYPPTKRSRRNWKEATVRFEELARKESNYNDLILAAKNYADERKGEDVKYTQCASSFIGKKNSTWKGMLENSPVDPEVPY